MCTLTPENIASNIEADAVPGIPRKWKEVIHDNSRHLVVASTENINSKLTKLRSVRSRVGVAEYV